MYDEIKLEKGLYNLSGKTFTDALEEMDPTAAYEGTPLEKLDAYERQLKKYDIRIKGAGCDRVEKFFSSTDSAVLFPEYISRSVRAGFDDTVLSLICAVKTRCDSGQYLGCTLDDSAAYETTAQSSSLPAATVTEDTATTALAKYGRVINASYESVRRQRIDLFGVLLRSIGVKLAASVTAKAIDVLKTSADSTTAGSLTYTALTSLYGKFGFFDMNTLIVSPANASKIAAMPEIAPCRCAESEDGAVTLPFGARLVKTPAADDTTLIGIDRGFALEFINGTDLLMETDRIIDRQLDRIGISVICGFRKITPDAVKVLTISA